MEEFGAKVAILCKYGFFLSFYIIILLLEIIDCIFYGQNASPFY